MIYAPLRHLEAIGIEHEGEEKILLRDPERICPEPLAVPMPLFFIASLLNGARDAREIQEIVATVSEGQLIPLEFIEGVVEDFDKYLLLDNERSAAERARLAAVFETAPTRPATHAGEAYPDDAAALRATLDEYYAQTRTRTSLILDAGGAPAKIENDAAAHFGPAPSGIIVPHIDLRVGGQSYARIFSRLPADKPADLYVILGVAHQPARNLFTVCGKDFETPLGLVETDREAVKKLQKLYGAERLSGQYIHKFEHSVEFPAVFLKHRHGAAPFKILPLLCGSLHEILEPGMNGDPRSLVPALGDFIDALAQLIAEYPGRVCIVASVDLSHVGLKFGDPKGIDATRAQLIETADRRMLACATARDAAGFMAHFREDANARNVDAVCAVYVMLEALAAAAKGAAIAQGDLVDYRQWHETDTDSMVTFAGAAFA